MTRLAPSRGIAVLLSARRTTLRLAPIGVVLAAALLRFMDLGRAQLYQDEAASWQLAGYPIGELLEHNVGKAYPPLYGVLLHAWMLLFGTGAAALRNPSAIAGVVTVVVAWRWAHEGLGRTAGLMTATVVAVSALLIANSREARMYSIETAFATIAWWLTWKLVADSRSLGQKPGRRTYLIAGALSLAVAGEVWTLAFGLADAGLQFLFVLASLALSSTSGDDRRLSDPGPWLAIGSIFVGAASFSVWLPTLLAVPLGGESFWTPRPDLGSLRDTFFYFLGVSGRVDLSAPAPIAAAVLVAAGIVGLAMPARRRPASGPAEADETADDADDKRRIQLLGLAAALGTSMVAVVWIYSQIDPVYASRYMGAAAVPLAILIAAGVVALARYTGGRALSAVLAVAVLVPMTGGAMLTVGNLDKDVDAAPGLQTAQELISLVRPGDTVLALDAQTYLPINYNLDHDADGAGVDDILYDWDAAGEPFYIGTSLVATDRVVSPATVARVGWLNAMPGLRFGGTVWLVTVTAGDSTHLGFVPLDSGVFVEQTAASVFVHPDGSATGQIRALKLRPFGPTAPIAVP